MAGTAAAFQVDLPDEEAYQKEARGAAGTLQVVECYQAWCGPTKAVQSTFRRFIVENPDTAANVKFYTANVSKVPVLSKYEGRCEPAFLFMKEGKVLEEVAGLNLPKLARLTLALATGGAAVQRGSSEE